MNSIMFDSPVCQRNLKTLTELGATVMGPRKARLSNGEFPWILND
jgi:phosphopantothenoylcysteine synthetase/decarboxylase